MPWYRLPDGGVIHIKMAGKPPAPCSARRRDGSICGCIAGFQCDWKVSGDTRVTHKRTFRRAAGEWRAEGALEEIDPKAWWEDEGPPGGG